MKYSVLQGLVLGPSLFNIYLYPLPSIIYKNPNIYYHLYADNIQLYMFLTTNSSPGLNNKLSNCANDIKEWLISNNILLYVSKTTLLNPSPSHIDFLYFLIDNIVISPSPRSSNLGVLCILLFPSFPILLLSLNLQIIIEFRVIKNENKLLYTVYSYSLLKL